MYCKTDSDEKNTFAQLTGSWIRRNETDRKTTFKKWRTSIFGNVYCGTGHTLKNSNIT
jgi:hypothetical protein